MRSKLIKTNKLTLILIKGLNKFWICKDKWLISSRKTSTWFSLYKMSNIVRIKIEVLIFKLLWLTRWLSIDCLLWQSRRPITRKLWPLHKFLTKRHNKTSNKLNSFCKRWSKIRCIGPETSWTFSKLNKKISTYFLISIRFISTRFFKRCNTEDLTLKLRKTLVGVGATG